MRPSVIPAVIALIALFLGSSLGRAALVQHAGTRDSRFSGWVTVIAWLANAVWSFRSWPWYWATLLVAGTVVLASLTVTARTVSAWWPLRHVITVATTASAGLLWAAYRPG